jgi:hypothetical protein
MMNNEEDVPRRFVGGRIADEPTLAVTDSGHIVWGIEVMTDYGPDNLIVDAH